MIRLFVLLLLFFVQFGYAQDTTKVLRMGLALNGLGTSGWVGGTADVLIAQRVNVELGFGIMGYGFGANYLIKKAKIQKIIPYIGIKYAFNSAIDLPVIERIYAPIGIVYYGKHGFFGSIDIGPAFVRHLSAGYVKDFEIISRYPYNSFGIYGNIKAGIRFQIFGNKNRMTIRELLK